MNLLIVTRVADGSTETGRSRTETRAARIGTAWAGRDQRAEATVHRLDEPVDYGDLLDVVLDAQPEVLLLIGFADDGLIRSVADVVWKFDSGCRVVAETGATTAVEAMPAGYDPEQVVDVLADRKETR